MKRSELIEVKDVIRRSELIEVLLPWIVPPLYPSIYNTHSPTLDQMDTQELRIGECYSW
jgi:hypothetical protein